MAITRFAPVRPVYVAFCAAAVAGAACAVNLSPERWPAARRLVAERAQSTSPSPIQAQAFRGSSGIVVSTLSPMAALAGVETLRNGGNAADAAIAAALTQITTALGTNISFAGIAEIVYYDAHSGRTLSLNAGWDAWSREHDRASLPSSPLVPAILGRATGSEATPDVAGRRTLVPGFMAGIEALHGRFGRLAFGDLFAPAIHYADQGITLSPMLAGYFQAYSPYLHATVSGRRFLQQSGSGSRHAGERFLQPALASTLRAVARDGAREMYRGAWAQDFVAAVNAAGGKASLDDLQRYRAQWIEPATGRFQGHEIRLSPATTGGQALLESLALVDHTGLVKPPGDRQSAQSLLDLSRIVAWSLIAPNSPSALAPFRAAGVDVSLAGRQTPTYASAIAPALRTLFTGAPAGGPLPGTPHTASVVVVDKAGNIAALIHTSNTVAWGSTGLIVGGIPIPDAAGLTAIRFPSARPGERIPHDMAPLIAFKDGAPVLAMATSGASFLHETVKVVVDTLGHGRDLPSVLAAPPLLLAAAQPHAGGTVALVLQVPAGAYGTDVLTELRAQGVSIRECEVPEVLALKGTPTVVRIRDGVAEAADVPGVFSFSMVVSSDERPAAPARLVTPNR